MKKQKVFIRLANIVVTILSVMFILVYGNNENLAEVSSSIYVTDIKINPQNTNELYAGIHGNGLYRSADKGETWIRCGVEIESFNNGITKIAFDPVEKNVYVGTFNDLFMSHDGNKWTNLKQFDLVYEIFIQPTDQKTIYISTSFGLYASTVDDTWVKMDAPEKLAAFGSSFYPVAIAPSDADIIYFAITRSNDIISDDVWDGSGIYKSTNHGRTLKKLLSTKSGILLVSSSDANVMYGVDRNIILKSIDGGSSWKEICKFGNNNTIDTLVMSPMDHNLLYIKLSYYNDSAERQEFLLKSIDGGKIWQDISSNVPINNRFVSGIIDRINNIIIIDPSNPDVLYIGTYRSGIFKSTDAGKTWKAINKGINPSREYGK